MKKKINLLIEICKVYEIGGLGWRELKFPEDRNIIVDKECYYMYKYDPLGHLNQNERQRVKNDRHTFSAWHDSFRVFKKKE